MSAPRERLRVTPAPTPSLPAVVDDVTRAFEQLAAGLWLLDAIDTEDLGFTDKTSPWWSEWPFPLSPESLKDWLRDMARRSMSAALAEGYRGAVAVCEGLAAQPDGRA
jgi:hypothetical protein